MVSDGAVDRDRMFALNRAETAAMNGEETAAEKEREFFA